jgi:hypothetical protein
MVKWYIMISLRIPKIPGRYYKFLSLILIGGLILTPGDYTNPSKPKLKNFQNSEKKQEAIAQKSQIPSLDQLLRSQGNSVLSTPSYEDLEFILSRTLWQEPYLIFQASYGEKVSDHYLIALDTKNGKLHLIHQGYHTRFWIENDLFYCLHIDQYYVSPFGKWEQLHKTHPPDLEKARKSLVFSITADLPPSLQNIEWANLHQVLEGSFSQPGRKELLFISGRKKGYYLALYSMHPDPFQLLWSELLTNPQSSAENDDFMFNFQQLMMQDMDRDGCQEVFIHGVDAAWNWKTDPLIYLNLSKTFKGKNIQWIYCPKENHHSGSLIRNGPNTIYWLFLEEKREYAYQIIKKTSQEIAIQARTLETEILSRESSPLHQDFFHTGRNLKNAPVQKNNSSKLYPEVRFPDTYLSEDPQLQALEKEYHRFRNEGIQLYIKKIDQGWNHFQSIPPLFNTSSDEANPAIPTLKQVINSWARCFDIIPVLIDQNIYYIAVNGFKGITNEHEAFFTISLFDQEFNKEIDVGMDSFGYNQCFMGNEQLIFNEKDPVSEQEAEFFSHRFLLPLPGQTTLWILYPFYRTHQGCSVIKITSQGFESLYKGANTGIAYHHEEMGSKFMISINKTHLIPSWGGGGNGVRMKLFYLIDPASYRIVSTLYPEPYRRELDRVYRQYYYFRYRQSSQHPFDIEEGLEFDMLQATEEIVYYGKDHFLNQLLHDE